jgi:NTP pyrophosphatase (non-canonical NTP hydrolase)
MDFDEYQKRAKETAIYPENVKIIYTAMGLCGEAGEVANKVKKKMRGDSEIDKEDLAKEMGDVLWYISQLATDLDIRLDDIANHNIEKLSSRKHRGAVKGNGDNR